MKALSKPISSPGRADKFPPPLMRFLRSNVGSRSRGRSRSSPLFYLRSRKSVPIETTQEPSSPKVTCIGQVRVRRATKGKGRGTAAVKRRGCWWCVKKPTCCGRICPRFRRWKNPFGRLFCKWGLVFRFGYCKKVGSKEDSFRVHSDKNRGKGDEEAVVVVAAAAGNNASFRSNVVGEIECNERDSRPPKNVLILTRCRSAPYRSSSLGGRFWGSPLGETQGNNEGKLEGLGEPRISEESSKELGNSVEKEEEEEFKGGNGGEKAVHPSVLTRCKSEPARTGERLVPESSFSWLNS